MTEIHRRKVVIYCRVASIKQTDDNSVLRSQQQSCKQFAKERGLDVIRVFSEQASGASDDRPELNLLLKLLKARREEGTVVIVANMLRLARSIPVLYNLRVKFEKYRAELISPSLVLINGSNDPFREISISDFIKFQRSFDARQRRNRMKGNALRETQAGGDQQ